MWEAQRAALERAGWHVVAPDLPGPDGGNALGGWADRVLAAVDGAVVPVGAGRACGVAALVVLPPTGSFLPSKPRPR
jgi:hypothetical protein